MDAIIQCLVASCRPAPAIQAGRLQVVPLQGFAVQDAGPEPPWQIHPAEPLRLSERLEEARVEEVQAFNDTPRDMVALDGELLAGGFQDRMLSASVLVRCRSAGLLPTACAEEGRFDGDDPHFVPTGQVASPRYRRRLRLGLHAGPGDDGPPPRQQAVWDDIESDRRALGQPGEGVSLLTLRRHADPACRRLVEQLGDRSRDAGWMIFLDGQFISGDLFAHQSLASLYGPALLQAAAYDAVVEEARGTPAPGPRRVGRQIPSGDWNQLASELAQALVLAQEITYGASRRCFDSPALTGAALLRDRRPVHLSFFPAVYADDHLSLDQDRL